jgi:hypothetical protein
MSAIKAFGAMLEGQRGICAQIGKALCQRLDVPYLEDREAEKFLGHRYTKESLKGTTGGNEGDVEGPLLPTREFRFPNGELLQTNEWPKRLFDEHAEQLTEEVWTHDNWPDSYNDVQKALQKCAHGITGVYFHWPSMNLVLLNASGEKVGIRSSALVIPLIGLNKENAILLGKLKKAATS